MWDVHTFMRSREGVTRIQLLLLLFGCSLDGIKPSHSPSVSCLILHTHPSYNSCAFETRQDREKVNSRDLIKMQKKNLLIFFFLLAV